MSFSRIASLEITLTKRSFKDCLVDITGTKQHDLSQHANLKDWVEFKNYTHKFPKDISNSAAIRYIVCMYDPKSPFNHLDYDDRKVCSAEYAEFPTDNDGVFLPSAQHIMAATMNEDPEASGKKGEKYAKWNKSMMRMIVRYCVLANGHDYATYRIIERNYYENTLTEDPLDVKKMATERQHLQELREKILNNENSEGVLQQFYRLIQEEEIKIRALRPEYRSREYAKQFRKFDVYIAELAKEEEQLPGDGDE